MVGASGRVLCLDLQPGMLQLLAPRLEANAVTNAEPVVADATRLPLADGCVDLAFLITVLGEMFYRTAALAELRRVLRPDAVYSPLENHCVTQTMCSREPYAISAGRWVSRRPPASGTRSATRSHSERQAMRTEPPYK